VLCLAIQLCKCFFISLAYLTFDLKSISNRITIHVYNFSLQTFFSWWRQVLLFISHDYKDVFHLISQYISKCFSLIDYSCRYKTKNSRTFISFVKLRWKKWEANWLLMARKIKKGFFLWTFLKYATVSFDIAMGNRQPFKMIKKCF